MLTEIQRLAHEEKDTVSENDTSYPDSERREGLESYGVNLRLLLQLLPSLIAGAVDAGNNVDYNRKSFLDYGAECMDSLGALGIVGSGESTGGGIGKGNDAAAGDKQSAEH